jgi:hypothetical protein
MRKGNGGTDMFRPCRANGVAAIHYTPVEDVNLSEFSENNLPPEWSDLEPAQKGSLRNVAWRICGGDVIYVAESYPSRIVGVGRVKGADGTQAYHFLTDTPVVDDDDHPWRHLVNVEWEQNFPKKGIRYPEPWAPQITVLELEPSETAKIKKLIRSKSKNDGSASHSKAGRQASVAEDGTEEEINLRQLEETAYTRYTTEALRIIDRKHVKLCNAFKDWLFSAHGIKCNIERRNIDATFRMGKQSVLVEFKVAYHSDPKPAIREALGQIFEYNHYPERTTHDQWILVLDVMPTETDRIFLKTLRKYEIPLSYGWQTSKGFQFSQESPLFKEVANGA